ncbi:MAG: membrane protein insertion efficiency factor YidD [Gammaproteobacteria bacterium]|nr:membrane protein insertion efficiency factor YidD [Gammaproteobacteria bacterium]
MRLIQIYRKHLSPRKGYSCAYAVVHGPGKSCSDYGLRFYRRYGPVKATLLMRMQFNRCSRVSPIIPQVCLAKEAAGCCFLGGLACCGA